MNIIDLFLAHAADTPDKPAIVFGDSSLSYAQVADLTGRLCGLLRSMGIREGDCLLVALDNGIEFTLTMLAAAELGAMLAPVATSMPVVAMQRSLEATCARFVVASNPVCRRLLDSAPGQDGRLSMLVAGAPIAGCRHFSELDRDDRPYRLGSHGADPQLDFLLTMTSGSTGDPKPITLSQAGKIRRSLDGARDLYGLDNDDVIITSTPMYHSLG
ncbi:MAG: acyl--CoA ligase, partial [Gammaproteobacteria bacterium]|nr:acyl--CoA ligase [Gammaproteobacteria bacterium]